MNKEEFLSKRDAIDLKLKELNGEKKKLEKEYIESNQGFNVGSKVCITVPAHERFSLLSNEDSLGALSIAEYGDMLGVVCAINTYFAP